VTRILCLHTADVHVVTFGALYAEVAPDAEVSHAVRADWLADARREGLTEKLNSDVRQFLREAAQAHDAVLCSCSTLGPLAEAAHADAPNIIRIDTPLMEAAAAHDGTVLVAFCLESTRAPTLALLTATYVRLGKEPRVEAVLCAEAWPLFERGETEGFADAIAANVRRAAVGVSDLGCIVLAQASMAVAVPLLGEMTVPVYASPRLAVTATLRAAAIAATRA
jgi:hypothetical protein